MAMRYTCSAQFRSTRREVATVGVEHQAPVISAIFPFSRSEPRYRGSQSGFGSSSLSWPGNRSSWTFGSTTSDMTAYSFGATPMPSRSNSAAVAWLSSSGSAFLPRWAAGFFGFGSMFFMLPKTRSQGPRFLDYPRRARAGSGLMRCDCADSCDSPVRQRATRVG